MGSKMKQDKAVTSPPPHRPATRTGETAKTRGYLPRSKERKLWHHQKPFAITSGINPAKNPDGKPFFRV